MNKTETIKQTIKTLIKTTAKTTTTIIIYTIKAIKLFIKTTQQTLNNNHNKHKQSNCQKCGKPSGKYKLCYQCHAQWLKNRQT